MEEKKTDNAIVDIVVAFIILTLLMGLLGGVAKLFLGRYVGFIDWLYSRDWSLVRFLIILAFSVVDFFLLVVLVHVFRKIAKFSVMQPTPEGEIAAAQEPAIHKVELSEEVHSNWQDIQKLAGSRNKSDWSMAVIRADAVLDSALQQRGYQGEDLAARLKVMSLHPEYRSTDRLFAAHRMRNAIAHNPMQEFSKTEIDHALNSYQTGLQELGLMMQPKPDGETPLPLPIYEQHSPSSDSTSYAPVFKKAPPPKDLDEPPRFFPDDRNKMLDELSEEDKSPRR